MSQMNLSAMNGEQVRSEIEHQLLALCPLDGRYHNVGEEFSNSFSEYALIANRVKVEVMWLRFLLENVKGVKILDEFDKCNIHAIVNIYSEFNLEDAKRVKEIEKVTNHDVKSVELFVAEKLKQRGMGELVSFVHIGCTSEDITNTAYANMVLDAVNRVWRPAARFLVMDISRMAKMYAGVPMLAHTHGQPATPTTVGKELAVYAYRLYEAMKSLKSFIPMGKFNGATGNYAAFSVAFPDENWQENAKHFVEGYLGLKFNPVTTQIENHDYMCQVFDAIRHFNDVLLGLNQDMWMYISMFYFKQVAVKNEVGSSTMPHKVNPINFENSEGNIFVANALFQMFSSKLSRSRMQRDLSDSTVQRYIGIAFGASLQAVKQTCTGLKKVVLNEGRISADLENNWAVLTEPIQTILRKYGVPDAYNQLKELTRGKEITKENIQEFIKSLDIISDRDRKMLLNMTPASYIGKAVEIADSI